MGLLSVESYGLSDTGKVRENNEDQFLVAELAKAMQVRQSSLKQPPTQFGDERGYLFAVADGVGGHKGGAEASALAVGSIEDFALNTLKWFLHLEGNEGDWVLSDFRNALGKADAKVFQESVAHPELRGMGTTLTIAYCLGTVLFVVHVGDSRAYLLREGKLHRLTHDHTMVAHLVEQGVLAPEEAKHHQWRHVITNVVGGAKVGIEAEMQRLEIGPGDVLLLCSDGLTEMIDDAEITAVLNEERDPKRASKRLVKAALDAGGVDNITVVVSRFGA